MLFLFAAVCLHIGAKIQQTNNAMIKSAPCEEEAESIQEPFGENTSNAEETQGAFQAELYIAQEIPELDDYGYYINRKSKGQAYLEVHCNRTDPVALYDNDKNLFGYYYPVFVYEKWEDHSVVWDSFHVREDFREILWCEIVELEFYSIEEWRTTLQYQNRMKSITEFRNSEEGIRETVKRTDKTKKQQNMCVSNRKAAR